MTPRQVGLDAWRASVERREVMLGEALKQVSSRLTPFLEAKCKQSEAHQTPTTPEVATMVMEARTLARDVLQGGFGNESEANAILRMAAELSPESEREKIVAIARWLSSGLSRDWSDKALEAWTKQEARWKANVSRVSGDVSGELYLTHQGVEICCSSESGSATIREEGTAQPETQKIRINFADGVFMAVPWLLSSNGGDPDEDAFAGTRTLCMMSWGGEKGDVSMEPLVASDDILEEMAVVTQAFFLMHPQHNTSPAGAAEWPRRVSLQIGFDPASVYKGALPCEPGEMMTALFPDPTKEWLLAVDAAGQRGWVPASHVTARHAQF